MIFSWAEDGRSEQIRDHVDSMLERWKFKYRRVYEKPLRRLIGDHADEAVRCAIIMHDVGKLTKLYQEYLKRRLSGEKASLRGYRHEVASAAIASLHLQGVEWGDLVAAAVLLSHEPILMGQVGEAGERYFTLTQAYRSLKVACTDGALELDSEGVSIINDFLKSEEFQWRLKEKYEFSGCLDALKGLVVRVVALGDVAVKRVRVAALSHVLTVIDSLSANESREEGDDGGTFVSRGARVAEVAEL
jgi:CRISPR-associated endonuclease Cas3-HD